MNVTPPQSDGPGSPASSRSHPHPTFTTVPTSPAYRIVNARVPADLAPAVADLAAADRFAACDIVVDGGRIAMLGPAGAVPTAADLPTIDLRDGIVLPRFVDVHTHIDKGHIWPRRVQTRTAPIPAPAWRLPPTARRTGAPMTCARAWISRCVAPSPTAPARSAPISIRWASRPPSPGRSSPRCASNGRTALRCKPSRSSRSTSRSMTSRSSAPSRRRSPATAAFWAALRSSAKRRDRSSSSRSTGCSASRSHTVSTSICTSTKAARPMR